MFILKDSWGLYGIKKAANAFRRSGSRGGLRAPRRVGGGTVYAYKFDHIILYQEKLDEMLKTPAGGLWKYLEVQSDLAVAGAKLMVGVKTGRLRESIKKKHTGHSRGQTVWIGSTVKYAYEHHQGTRPHTITPKSKSELVFVSKSRVLVHTRAVHHPGTKPNPYLASQLHFFDVH